MAGIPIALTMRHQEVEADHEIDLFRDLFATILSKDATNGALQLVVGQPKILMPSRQVRIPAAPMARMSRLLARAAPGGRTGFCRCGRRSRGLGRGSGVRWAGVFRTERGARLSGSLYLDRRSRGRRGRRRGCLALGLAAKEGSRQLFGPDHRRLAELPQAAILGAQLHDLFPEDRVGLFVLLHRGP